MADAQQIVERFMAAARSGDVASLTAMLAADFRLVEPPSLPYGGEYQGPDGFLQFLAALSAEVQMLPAEDEYVAADDKVWRRSVFRARSKRNEAVIEQPFAELFTVGPDGLIVRIEPFYWDTHAVGAVLSAV